MKRFKTAIGLVMVTTAVLGGCAQQSLTGDAYSAREARQVQTVQFGTVESVRPVVIEGRTDGVVGTGAGAIIGGIAGSTVGGGRGSAIASVVGAVAGGMVGQNIEEASTRRQGQEITVRLDSGAVYSVVQEVENEQYFRPGDRIRMLSGGGQVRITY